MENNNCQNLVDSYRELIGYKDIFDFSSGKLCKDNVKKFKKKNFIIKEILKGIRNILNFVVIDRCEELLNHVCTKEDIVVIDSCVSMIYKKYQDYYNSKKYSTKSEDLFLCIGENMKSFSPITIINIGISKYENQEMNCFEYFDMALKLAQYKLTKNVDTLTFDGVKQEHPECIDDMVYVCKKFVDYGHIINKSINFNDSDTLFLYPSIYSKIYCYLFKKIFNDDNSESKKSWDILKYLSELSFFTQTHDYFDLMIFIKNNLMGLGSVDDFCKGVGLINSIVGSKNKYGYHFLEVDAVCISAVKDGEPEYYKSASRINDRIENGFLKVQSFMDIFWYSYNFPMNNKKGYIKFLDKAINVTTSLKKEEKDDSLCFIFENQLFINDLEMSLKIVKAIPSIDKKISCLCKLALHNISNKEIFDHVCSLIDKDISKAKQQDLYKCKRILADFYSRSNNDKKVFEMINSIQDFNDTKSSDLKSSILRDYVMIKAELK